MLATAAGVGFALGLRHALDPDHVVAVSTLVSERPGLRRCSAVGALWGLGHGLALTAVGAALVAFKLTVPHGLARGLELGVALMLVGLGAAAIRKALRYRLHAHSHAHDGRAHVHVHVHGPGQGARHDHRHPFQGGLKPFLVGLAHGLAGSAGLTLLALALGPSPTAGLACVAMLGLGSLTGMVVLTALMSLPLSLLAARYGAFERRAQLAAGAASLALGGWLLVSHLLGAAGPPLVP
jgi:ABC-type nickel/cobalt efflux system permease component RcnA